MSNLLSINEVCNLYDVTRKTLYNLHNAQKLSFVKKGKQTYVYESEIAKLKRLRKEKDSDTELHSEISALKERVRQLECQITQLLQCNNAQITHAVSKTVQSTQSDTHEQYNNNRKEAVIAKGREAYAALLDKNITPTEFARSAGIDRRTAKKYWAEITAE